MLYNLSIILCVEPVSLCKDLSHFQEKIGAEKNSAFVQDFKTLADVLIQETVRHDLATQYPKLAEHIKVRHSTALRRSINK